MQDWFFKENHEGVWMLLLNEKNLVLMRLLRGRPEMSKNEIFYKEVKRKVQHKAVQHTSHLVEE